MSPAMPAQHTLHLPVHLFAVHTGPALMSTKLYLQLVSNCFPGMTRSAFIPVYACLMTARNLQVSFSALPPPASYRAEICDTGADCTARN